MSENTLVGAERQYLTFLMGKDQYALDILTVKEIIAYTEVLRIPMLPEHIKGVINLRGHVVPVIDLAFRFGKKQTEISKLTCFIIVEITRADRTTEIGVMVDSVNEVISLAADHIEETPDFGGDVQADFISGVGRINEKFIIMLNVSRILDNEDFKHLERAARQGKQVVDESQQKEESANSEDQNSGLTA